MVIFAYAEETPKKNKNSLDCNHYFGGVVNGRFYSCTTYQ